MMNNSNLMCEIFFEEIDWLNTLWDLRIIRFIFKFVKYEFGDNFIVRRDGRLTLAKRLGFYKRLFSGEVDKLGQMIR